MTLLAATACVTQRHLLRLFSEHTVTSPLNYVRTIHLKRARQALQHRVSVIRASQEAGFNSDLQLRRAWKATFGGSPTVQRPNQAL